MSFALENLFDSRTNNRALLLWRLLFLFRRYRRLKDQLFICLFVKSLLLLILLSSPIIFPIVIFIATVVAMIIISYNLKSYFTIIVFITCCISFFFSFFFHFDLKDPIWVVWLPFLLIPNHCPFSVTWEILGVEMEDGRQSWRLTAERCLLLLDNSSRV